MKDFQSKASYAGMALLMALTGIVSLLLVIPVENAGLEAFENPDSMSNIILFVFLMLVFTAVLLILIKWKAKIVITAIIALSLMAVVFYVALSLLSLVYFGIPLYIVSGLISLAAILLLWFHPEWYVINFIGIIVCAGCASIFGVSLSVIPVIVLLVFLMIYDYISVRKSKHMLTLADGVLRQKMPIMFIVPKDRGYSFKKSGLNLEAKKDDRGAFMIGMGDMIMPSILVVSAQVYAGGSNVISVLGVSLPALGAFFGGILGLCLLMIPLSTGKPQPGLPWINGFAIAGFLICCAVSGSWDWLTLNFW
ncbi:MAG: presenilin family intramembrane aspartyl protease PSH [Methanocorpusculum sp.]|nr:presenilin family intramembrane aspartyl protease PSH [Methanocorpusculum sp.]